MLSVLDDPMEREEAMMADATGSKGCSYCGGLGHRIADCPRLSSFKDSQISASGRKDYFGSGGYGGEI